MEKNNKEKKEELVSQDKTVTISEAEYLKLKEAAAKAEDHWDRILRMQAEFENTKKRLERDKQEFIKFANERIVMELLNVLDDLERTVELAQSKHQDLSAFLKGVEMILAHLYEMLKEHGVKPIEAKNKKFDPSFHEALMEEQCDDLPEHTIVEELQKGYLLNDRVVRTSKVKVSKKCPQSTDHGSQA
ncbi:MAG: nucleotide exchange factor GrpE [Candidatus Omnitrophota bacterium]|jgi:molecular chaperone GrpE|nr:MAG: nucleotide exchange factor GrpE [Candidatus Omnitrophota bacterium]